MGNDSQKIRFHPVQLSELGIGALHLVIKLRILYRTSELVAQCFQHHHVGFVKRMQFRVLNIQHTHDLALNPDWDGKL